MNWKEQISKNISEPHLLGNKLLIKFSDCLPLHDIIYCMYVASVYKYSTSYTPVSTVHFYLELSAKGTGESGHAVHYRA